MKAMKSFMKHDLPVILGIVVFNGACVTLAIMNNNPSFSLGIAVVMILTDFMVLAVTK